MIPGLNHLQTILLTMICQRCGCCCIHLAITIVDPKAIRPGGQADRQNPPAMIFKPAGQRCPHLILQGELATCAIHHLDCYRGTPCELFEQVGPEDAACIMSAYFRSLAGKD